MAEGTSTFLGRGVGLRGNYEIQGDDDTLDTLTVTGASSSAAGVGLVVQNSTGTEYLTVSSSGQVTFSQALVFSGSVSHSAGFAGSLSSTTQVAGLIINVTSTGAIAETGTNVNGIVVSANSKSVLNSVIQYSAGAEGTVSTAVSFLAVSGTKAPTYFLKVGNSTFGLGASAHNGFWDTSLSFGTFPTSAVAVAGIKMLAGTKAYYIIAYPDTALS